MLFRGKIPFHVAARLLNYEILGTPFATITHYLPLFATFRHYSHYSRLFALFVLFAIRDYSLFALRDYSLFAIRDYSLFAICNYSLFAARVFQTPNKQFVVPLQVAL